MNEEWRLPWDGGCRCGQVRFRVTAAPLITMACHCSGCQVMSASAFSMSMLLLAHGFTLTAGEPVIGGLHGKDCHYFCLHCKSWMFTRPGELDHLVALRPTLLDDHAWVAPFIETYTREKLPWASTSAAHRFEAFPPMEVYPELMTDFAARGARPGRA